MDREPNFFLYDEQINRNIDAQRLDFTHVALRLDNYIADLGGVERLIGNRELDGGVVSVLKPLVAFRLLQLVSDDNHVFELINQADDKTVTMICHALEMADEKNMTAAILKHHQQGGNADNFRKYLVSNNKYIQNKIMSYVKRNLELFY